MKGGATCSLRWRQATNASVPEMAAAPPPITVAAVIPQLILAIQGTNSLAVENTLAPFATCTDRESPLRARHRR